MCGKRTSSIAATIVRLYHGEEAVAAAEARYRSVAAGGVPENMETQEAAPGTLLTELLVQSGLAPSRSEARRLMTGGGVKLDGTPVKDPNRGADGQRGIHPQQRQKQVCQNCYFITVRRQTNGAHRKGTRP